jgi:hypothetical protein
MIGRELRRGCGRMMFIAGCLVPAVLLQPATAADLTRCLKLDSRPGGEASLANGCSQRLNVMLCVEGGQGARRCADKPNDVITLFPGGTASLAAYTGQSVHWAVCVYPEAPVGWDPGPDRPYTCKKTCVMC